MLTLIDNTIKFKLRISLYFPAEKLTRKRQAPTYESSQGALWGYSICQNVPQLIFAVSLGEGPLDILVANSKEKGDELSPEIFLYPFSDPHALFEYLLHEICYSRKPYNANNDDNRKIFKLLLLKAESEKTYNPDRTYGLIKGYGATGDHFSIVFADPAGSFNGESHMYTALHELGHNLGSTHAPVSIPPTEFNVDKHWYEKMHLDFQDSPYFQGKIGVPGHLFYLDDSNAGANIRVSWRNEYNRTLNKNSNDIMGYNNIESLIWISDRNFAQWYQHLNSSKAVTKRDFQAVKQLPE